MSRTISPKTQDEIELLLAQAEAIATLMGCARLDDWADTDGGSPTLAIAAEAICDLLERVRLLAKGGSDGK